VIAPDAVSEFGGPPRRWSPRSGAITGRLGRSADRVGSSGKDLIYINRKSGEISIKIN